MQGFVDTLYFQLGIYLTITLTFKYTCINIISRIGKSEVGVTGNQVFQRITGTDALLSQNESFSHIKSNQIAQIFNQIDNTGVEKSDMYAYVKAAYLSQLFLASQKGSYAARLILWLRKYFAFTEKFSGAMVFATLLDYFINSNNQITGPLLFLLHFQLFIISIISLATVPYIFKSYTNANEFYNEGKLRSFGVQSILVMLHFNHFFRAWGAFLQIGTVFRWLLKND